MRKYMIPMLHLQVFAEGAGGAAGSGDGGTAQGAGVTEAAAVPQTKGAKNNPLANVKYGIQPATEESVPAAEVQKEATPAEPVDRNAEFEKLIKGEYKDLYDAKMQDTIQKRLKGTKETVDKFTALTPTLELLAKKYGVKADDIEALNKAIDEDDSYFEQEALEKNISVEQLKAMRKMEQENAELRRQMKEKESKENADRLYAQWAQQEQETKKVYPKFDMRSEMQNPQFLNLLRSNVDVKTAYEVIHKDEIIPAAMQFAAKTVEQKLANNIAANGKRPAENGVGSQGAALVKNDVSQLTKADRQEIARRVARGERIVF